MQALKSHLKERLGALFDLDYGLLFYDVTSTYFGAPGQAWRIQRVPPRQGAKPPRRESSLGLMELVRCVALRSASS